MLHKPQGQLFLSEKDLYQNEKYKDVGFVQLALEDIFEAAKNGRTSPSFKLEKDKSGEVTLLSTIPERIVPLVTTNQSGIIKSIHCKKDFHSEYAMICAVSDIRDGVKMPVMDETIEVPALKLA